jgi:predicted ATPase/DNA-binding XRE family transcriptional regulator
MAEPPTLPSADALCFGDVLRCYRVAAGLTQEALADRSGLSTRGISDLERGRRTWPRKDTVRLLLAALQLTDSERTAFLRAARRPTTPRAVREHEAATPLTTNGSITTALPISALPFIGRSAELATLRRMLLDPATRLVTLTGSGGSGKTRLALEIGRQLIEAFPDGVVFVDLAALRDPALVLPAIAGALNLQEVGGQPLLPTLKARLQGQRLLLILDNCEQLLPAGPELAALISAPSGPTMLVTSRERLHVQAEHELLVRPLPVPAMANDATLALLGANDSVALFVQRALLSQQDFALTGENAAAVAAICRRLEGLPLAIELAAARVKILRPDALLARLDQRLPLLTGGPRDVPLRQQTLRDTIAWSYHLLAPEEQALLRRLAVFAGDWSLAAAQAVLDPDGAEDMLDRLASLVDKSLIFPIDSPTADPRFGMLETIREFAREELAASGEETRLRDVHAWHFLTLAETVDREIESAPDLLPGLDQGQTDHDNLRAALTTFIEENDADAAQRLAGALGLFWYHRGFWSEGRGWLERVLALPGQASPISTSKALARLGLLAHAQGDEARATCAVEESLALSRVIGDQAGVANDQFVLGFIALDAGEFATAERWIIAALPFYQELGDAAWLTQMWLQFGCAAAGLGNVEDAEQRWDNALACAREVGDSWGMAVVDGERGWLLCERGRYHEAADHLHRALSELRDLDCVHDLCRFLPYVAGLAAASGHVDRAARLYGGITIANERLGFRPKPVEHARTEHALKAIHARLDDDAFAAAWSAGQALRWANLVTEALTLTEELAAARSLHPPPGLTTHLSGETRLPRPLTRLIGRDEECREIAGLLRDERTRLLTLTGPGGVGKTRLALAVAAELGNAFRDGVVFVDLAPLPEPSQVVPAIAAALNLTDQGTIPLIEALRRRLSARQTLLVLDNFEHLLAAAPIVSSLLQSAPEAQALVTSRAVLRLHGEREYAVAPLPTPDPSAALSLAQLADWEAIQLFVERARGAQPGFRFTAENASDVTAICQRLDGLPLAIELAAARVKLLTPAALLTRLERRFSLFAEGMRDAPPRQRTLQAAIAWSYDLLDPPEQALFRCLAVFAGGWTLEAAETVGPLIGVPNALEALAALVDQNLVVRDDAGPNPRYRLLETIREFASEQLLSAGEENQARHAQLHYILELARENELERIDRELGTRLSRLQAEDTNLRAGIAWALKRDPGCAVAVLAALGPFWILGDRPAGRDLLEQAITTGVSANQHEWAHVLKQAAWLASLAADYARAEPLAKTTRVVAEQLGDVSTMAHAQMCEGAIAVSRDDVVRATSLLTDALAQFEVIGDLWGMMMSYTELGIATSNWGDAEASASYFERFGAICLEHNLPSLYHAHYLDNLSYTYRQLERYEEAMEAWAAASWHAKHSGNLYYMAGSPGTLARLLLELGEPARAVSLSAEFAESLRVMWELGAKWDLAPALEVAGALMAAGDQAEPAVRVFGAADALRAALPFPIGVGDRGMLSRAISETTTVLGELAFTQAWTAGQTQSLETTVAEARAVLATLAN